MTATASTLMKKTAQSLEIDTEKLSRLGAGYLKTLFPDRIDDEAVTMDDALGELMETKAQEMTERLSPGLAFWLVQFGAKFALDAGEIIRTQPAPAALEMIKELVSSIEANIDDAIEKAA